MSENGRSRVVLRAWSPHLSLCGVAVEQRDGRERTSEMVTSTRNVRNDGIYSTIAFLEMPTYKACLLKGLLAQAEQAYNGRSSVISKEPPSPLTA